MSKALEYTNRLYHLGALEDGWDGRNSKAPTAEARLAASHIAPVPLGDGGIQIELHAGGVDVEIEIAPDGKVRSVATYPASAD